MGEEVLSGPGSTFLSQTLVFFQSIQFMVYPRHLNKMDPHSTEKVCASHLAGVDSPESLHLQLSLQVSFQSQNEPLKWADI